MGGTVWYPMVDAFRTEIQSPDELSQKVKPFSLTNVSSFDRKMNLHMKDAIDKES